MRDNKDLLFWVVTVGMLSDEPLGGLVGLVQVLGVNPKEVTPLDLLVVLHGFMAVCQELALAVVGPKRSTKNFRLHAIFVGDVDHLILEDEDIADALVEKCSLELIDLQIQTPVPEVMIAKDDDHILEPLR